MGFCLEVQSAGVRENLDVKDLTKFDISHKLLMKIHSYATKGVESRSHSPWKI